MEENNKEQNKNAPKDLIGKGSEKAEITTKTVVDSGSYEDPYGGTLTKTNWLLLGLIVLSCAALLTGAIWAGYAAISRASETSFKFALIKTPVIILIVAFIVLVGSCVLKAIVEKKRMNAYSSKHEKKQLIEIKHKEIVTEKAKQGQSTSETTLTIDDTKESSKFCPHCKQKIPQSSGMFCPKCGKRMDIAPEMK